jgi:hypothetical protein
MQLEPLANTRLVKVVSTGQPFGLIIESKVFVAYGALRGILNFVRTYLDQRQTLELVFGGGRWTCVLELVEQLGDDRVETGGAPCVVLHIAVQLKHADWRRLKVEIIGMLLLLSSWIEYV